MRWTIGCGSFICLLLMQGCPPLWGQSTLVGPHGMRFIRIEPGEFTMGCSIGDADCNSSEAPRHTVRITRGFEIGIHEVTQAQWGAVTGSNPSRFWGRDRPIENVSWNDIQRFLQVLNKQKDGYRYRLPTEAEWEYAARAGVTEALYGELDAIAWHRGNSEGHTHPVGRKQPNAWGLYDMLGNVREWVDDWWLRKYEASIESDPTGPTLGQFKMTRGGSYVESLGALRIPHRSGYSPVYRFNMTGFRCVRELTR